MDKSYRIRTDIGNPQEKVIKVNIRQDIDTIEMLSLKLSTNDTYKYETSNYGVIVGRVIANGGVGVPNAKVSIFIPLSKADALRPDISTLYPYRTISDVDSNGRRYNLLPMTYKDNEHVAVGTFPSAQTVLDNDAYLEIYEKYYKYTTVTNNSGDYMICGVPTGSQTIHMDLDLSDIGFLSQKPYDMIFKGYNENLFESPTKFKGGKNLNVLPQIIMENDVIEVYPFWGDQNAANASQIAITRKDFSIDYEITPTCVFMGSVITDNNSNYISDMCVISEDSGDLSQMNPSEGTIEMIRQRPDGTYEEYSVNDNKVINSDGVWCYQIPMNLDYITTNEEGLLVPTDDTTKGIPTRTRARFRITLVDSNDDFGISHSVSHIVPNRPPIYSEAMVTPDTFTPFLTDAQRNTMVSDFNSFKTVFLSDQDSRVSSIYSTKDLFRDLLWNCVYSVKGYIPRIQNIEFGKMDPHIAKGHDHTGIKGVNKNGSKAKNPFPYNKINLDIPITSFLLSIMKEYDSFKGEYGTINDEGRPSNIERDELRIRDFLNRYHRLMNSRLYWYFYSETYEQLQNDDELFGRLMEENDTVSFDFYNDWINGCLYFPQIKKSGTNSSGFCGCNTSISNLYLNNGCSLDYEITGTSTTIGVSTTNDSSYDVDSIYGLFNPKPTVNGPEKWGSLNVLGCNDFHHRLGEVKLTHGMIYGAKVNGVDQYSYCSTLDYHAKDVDHDPQHKGEYYIYGSFMTDIILLGSVDDYNFMGIPSVKNLKLPKTSATVVNMIRSDATKSLAYNDITGDTSVTYSYTTSNSGYSVWQSGDYNSELRKTADNDVNMEKDENKAIYGREDGFSTSATSTSHTATPYATPPIMLNGAYWGSIEYARRITIGFRKYRFLGYFGKDDIVVVDPIRFYTEMIYRNNTIPGMNNVSAADNGTHCLLGQGLFFGRNQLSWNPQEYVTKPKTCINLERLCELSVVNEDSIASLDTQYVQIGYGNADMTGIISQEQIVDHQNRSLFSTLNSIKLHSTHDSFGFVTYNLRYNFVDGFDGFMNGYALKALKKKSSGSSAKSYFVIPFKENQSIGYIKFRYGENPTFNQSFTKTEEGEVKTYYRFPIYDNSFYFYFGINANATAIDKLTYNFL